MSSIQYLIGIDLGTTNCTLSYAPFSEESSVSPFLIPQVIGANSQSEQPALPSFIYFPLEEEIQGKIAAIEWDKERSYCTGIFARERGSELPNRLIASAKSWLCCSGIDRRAPLLPLESEGLPTKLSPLHACSHLLRHLKEAWNAKMGKAKFEKQQIYVTVPASFDPSARQLVQEAAELADYPEMILLEEPQAAFYAWLENHKESWRQKLKVGDRILVIDIGGGTTDFSLIGVENESGNLSLSRLAVGTHLLLGGDNLDLALAHFARAQIEQEGGQVDDWQMQGLIHSCRQAKELLLQEGGGDSVPITILGRGRRLIGGSITTQLRREDVDRLILDGFFPLISPDQHSPVEKRLGLQQVGLPYAQDPRVSSQLAKFLSMTGESENQSMERFQLPTAVLFNGGTLKSPALRNRLMELLNRWAQQFGKESIKELPGADYDQAVSIGAVCYGRARQGKGMRIRSGTSRSYFVGVEDACPAIPGLEPPLKAVCVAPFGMEEGTEVELDNREFALVVGEQATFRFFSRATSSLSDGSTAAVGSSIGRWKQELTELHPIEVRLEKGEEDGKMIHVKLKSRVTELGMLELFCSAPNGRKWKLEFDIRKESVS